MPELRNATVTIGNPGLNGGGVTSGALAAAVADRAPAAGSYITKVAEAGLTGEFALGTLTTGLLKVTTATGDLSIATAADLPAHTSTGVVFGIPIILDGGGAVIASGVKGDMYFPFACTITSHVALADQSGTGSVEFWTDTYANYPPTAADTNFTVSLGGSIKNGPIAVSMSIASGSTLRWNVPSTMTSITRFSANLIATRTV